MVKICDKFWIENISSLFCNFQLVPLTTMTLEEQMNSLTRLLLLIFLIVLVFSFRSASVFIILSLVMIIILYYIQKRTMENYQYYKPSKEVLHAIKEVGNSSTIHGPTIGTTLRSYSESVADCKSRDLFNPTPSYKSLNQSLVGPPNPKTLIKPIVVPPLADLSYWKANNMAVKAQINEQVQIDNYLSGYDVSTCCGNTDNLYAVPEKLSHIPKDGQPMNNPTQNTNYKVPTYVGGTYNNQQGIVEGYNQENNKELQRQHAIHQTPYSYSLQTENPKPGMSVVSNEPGWVNTSCGYNPRQLVSANLPTNFPAGNCEQNPAFKQYNKNLFTQNIQPGIYTTNQIIEPINSNIGISFDQQFEPTTCKRDDKGLTITQHDPRIIEPARAIVSTTTSTPVNRSNIYDPRFNGYGTSYRAYEDKLLGQTRFMYDDINSVKGSNYITRNNIDFAPYADSVGPMSTSEGMGNEFNSHIRSLAQDNFLRSSLQQRTDLQERLMRKVNSTNGGWQRRVAPINTMGSVGSNMSCN